MERNNGTAGLVEQLRKIESKAASELAASIVLDAILGGVLIDETANDDAE